MTHTAITLIATIDGGTATRETIEAAVREALGSVQARLIPCNWTPDPDAIAEQIGIAYNNVELLDLNRGASSEPKPIAPELELLAPPSNGGIALDAAVRLLAAAIKPVDLDAFSIMAPDLGQAAEIATELADTFTTWLDSKDEDA